MDRTLLPRRHVVYVVLGAGVAWSLPAVGVASATVERPSTSASLELARQFIFAVEAKNLRAVARTLSPGARQIFMHTTATSTPAGRDDIVAGRDQGALCVASLDSKKEVLAYTEGLFEKFTPLRWIDTTWSATKDGRRVFFEGKGDMTTRTNRPYQNNYVIVFRIDDGQITQMKEYGDVSKYLSLGIPPNEVEAKSIVRACALRQVLPG